jgi:putative transposase
VQADARLTRQLRLVHAESRRSSGRPRLARAWRMALARRRPTGRLVHHADRGCQSAGQAYRGLLARAGIRARMSRRGNCWDHAPVESFFSTLKAELVPDRPWADPATAAAAIGEYLEAFDNRRRLQSSLGYLTPVAYDTKLERPT